MINTIGFIFIEGCATTTRWKLRKALFMELGSIPVKIYLRELSTGAGKDNLSLFSTMIKGPISSTLANNLKTLKTRLNLKISYMEGSTMLMLMSLLTFMMEHSEQIILMTGTVRSFTMRAKTTER